MRVLITAALLWGIAAAGPAAAAENSQQDRMKACNAEAKEKALSGDKRKAFMSECLSADAKKGNSQQEKMKTCNAEAKKKQLSGDARKEFMKSCLSG